MATKNHPNLVRLVGYCLDFSPVTERMEQIVIYEFMPHGDLEQWIGPSAKQHLTIRQRLEILIGVARGLEYLHGFGIVHRDIKPANILLDEKLEAKIADFELVRHGEGTSVAATRVMGTPGYVDPAYYKSQKATPIADVYSFGVVMLTVLTARKAIINLEEDHFTLKTWAAPLVASNNMSSFKDPHLEAPDSLVCQLVRLALSCTAIPTASRPSMGRVLACLLNISNDFFGPETSGKKQIPLVGEVTPASYPSVVLSKHVYIHVRISGGMDGGMPAPGGGGMGGGEMELMSRSLQIEQKLFYLDLKDNPRGRFLKISEKTAMNRSTIIVPLAGVVWFVDLFNYYANGANDAELSSKELQLDTKVFYFDVGENARGRFLKVSEASMARARSTIIVPAGGPAAEGWAAFRNVLVEIHEASIALPSNNASGAVPATQVDGSFHHTPVAAAPAAAPATGGAAEGGAGAPSVGTAGGPSTGGGSGPGGNVLASRVIRAEQKRFFLDLGSNVRGQFLKVSEVQGTDRSVIIIPAQALEQIHEALGQFVQVLKAQPPPSPLVRTLAPQPKRTGDS
ncbi:unnamed protein product [Closterium sp. NIES-53]